MLKNPVTELKTLKANIYEVLSLASEIRGYANTIEADLFRSGLSKVSGAEVKREPESIEDYVFEIREILLEAELVLKSVVHRVG